MKFIWTMLAVVSIGYLALCLLLYFRQDNFIFFPEMPGRQLEATPKAINLDYEDVRVETEDGVSLHGWFIPAEEAKVTLLFCHGNAGNISHRLESIALFNSLGLNVLIFDYRGYGQSTGTISEAGLYLDIHAMWQELTDIKGIDPRNIVIFGRSLGAAVASQLATKVRPGGVILESAFASVPDMAARLYPFLPARILARYQLNNMQHVKSIQSPLLVIHSADDEIIPYSQGQKVFETAHEPKSFLRIRGSHNGGFIYSGRFYIEGFEAFLIKHFPDYEPFYG